MSSKSPSVQLSCAVGSVVSDMMLPAERGGMVMLDVVGLDVVGTTVTGEASSPLCSVLDIAECESDL